MTSNTKKVIALNTAYLYLRGVFSLFIGLYISRVLLQTLGVNDFGLYGVVGGIVGFFSFLNMAMSSSSSRYITYELAKGNVESQKSVFTVVFIVHLCIAILTILFAETLGLWYVCNKLVVPEGRMLAVHWVYQMSILVSILNITQVPYNALITAHEKMGFMSLWGSVGDLFRLAVVLSLIWITSDKLILYAILIFIVNLIVAIGYRQYCKHSFEECHLIRIKSKQLFKDILSFASFTAFSSFAYVSRQQGSILLINRFFGVAVNAAGNLATMVSGNVYGFTQNMVTAFRPQIIKNYAVNDISSMQSNISTCMKYSLAIYSIIVVPLFIEMNYVLKLWLVDVPEFTADFCRLTLIGSAFGLLNLIITIAIQATSKVKRNTFQISLLALSSILMMYVFFLSGLNVYWAFIIFVITEAFNLVISMLNLKLLIPQIKLMKFVNVILRIGGLIILMATLSSLTQNLTKNFTFANLLLVTITYILCFGICFYFTMLNRQSRSLIWKKISIMLTKSK